MPFLTQFGERLRRQCEIVYVVNVLGCCHLVAVQVQYHILHGDIEPERMARLQILNEANLKRLSIKQGATLV